jgi:hypothetical protein
MNKRLSLEITINIELDANDEIARDIEIVEWQFEVNPPDRFDDLSPVQRAALWSKLRDEIEEYWISAALESSPDATWNRLLEHLDLDFDEIG